MSPFPTSLASRMASVFAMSVLAISGARAAEGVVPSDKVIPKPAIFAAESVFNEAMMDEASLGFVKGKTFKADKFPYTLALGIDKPKFDIDVYYWDSAENAKKSFLEGKDALANAGEVTIEALAKDGAREFYQFNMGGSLNGCSMVIRNVHFILKDQYKELGKEKTMEMTRLYAAFLESAPSGGSSASMADRKWKNAAGKEIEGTVNSYDPKTDTVDFTRADGKQFPTLPLKTFSQEDQDFLRKQGSNP